MRLAPRDDGPGFASARDAKIVKFPVPRPGEQAAEPPTAGPRRPDRRLALRAAVCITGAVAVAAVTLTVDQAVSGPAGARTATSRPLKSSASVPSQSSEPSAVRSGQASPITAASAGAPTTGPTPLRSAPAQVPPLSPAQVPSPALIAAAADPADGHIAEHPSKPVAAPAHATPGPATRRPAAPPVVTRARATVQVRPATGTGPLGRDVVAAGSVGNADYYCYAVGWYVVNQKQWAAHYIKTLVTGSADGTFQTGELQMGADGERTSSWYPFVLGGTPQGCAWLTRLWEQTSTGEYRQAWPPFGLTVLYQDTTPVHRTS